MSRICSLATVVALFVTGALTGCTPPPAVAVIELDVVARALGRDDAMTQQVNLANETLRQQLRQAAERLRSDLQVEQDSLGEKPSEEAQERFEQLLADANRQLEQTQRAVLLRSNQFQQAVVTDFRREVAGVAREIATQHNARVVLSSNSALLWYDASLDITDEVIAEMRARSREGEAPAAAPAQPAAEPPE